MVAASAGNHAQAVARHAKLLGIVATIVMPKFTPTTKVTRTAAWGAKVVLHGETLAEAAAHALHLAEIHQSIFVHPYDDEAVIAGQGTLALELLEDAPDLDALVIPVGGGGLLDGCLVAATAIKPGIAVYGFEVEAYAALAQRLAGRPVSVGGSTIAEGIAVRDIGEVPFEIVRRRLTDMLVVPERAVEEAIGLLVEGGKTVAEGAGATGIAALLTCIEQFRGRKLVSRSPAATSTRGSCPTCCCAHCCGMGGCCGCICKFPTGPGSWRTLPARSGTAAAISSRYRTNGCTRYLPSRRRSLK